MITMIDVDEELLKKEDAKYKETLEHSWSSIFEKLGEIYAPSRLLLLSGTTGAGKSRVSLAEAINSAKLGKKVLYIHTEMSDSQVCSIVRNAWDRRITGKLTICSIDTFDDFRDYYEKTKLRGFDFIILDYLDLNLFDYTSDAPGYQMLNHIMRNFDRMRKDPEFKGCFLISAQLNGRVNANNSLDSLDIAGSKGIERSVDYHFSISPGCEKSTLNISVRKDRYSITQERNFTSEFDYTYLDTYINDNRF